jgi:RimJ/RimL family protein N-acetyltransferase
MTRIRPATSADTPALYAFQADPVACEMAAFPSRDREAFEAHQTRVLADPTCLVYAIEADGQLVGSIGSWDGDGEREVGYWLGRDHWGRGHATEAVRAFLEVETTRPLFAYVAPHNEASKRVVTKVGFAEIGTHSDGDVEHIVFRLDAED